MESPVIENVDSPAVEIYTGESYKHHELELILDVSNNNIKELTDVFNVVANVIYNEIEYIIICDRLNEIYTNYKENEIFDIIQLTGILDNKMAKIYSNNSKIKKFYDDEHRIYILTLENDLFNKLSELKDNYEYLRSNIETKNDCIVKPSKKPKIMKKAKGKE